MNIQQALISQLQQLDSQVKSGNQHAKDNAKSILDNMLSIIASNADDAYIVENKAKLDMIVGAAKAKVDAL